MTDKTNNQTLGEEIANAITHGLGALLAIAATAVAIVYSCFVSDALGIVSSAIYGFTLIVMYVNSTIYHSLKNNRAKRVFRIFDHCSIFVLLKREKFKFLCLIWSYNIMFFVLFFSFLKQQLKRTIFDIDKNKI